ncbi:MAG: carbon starvation protein A [Deltaproteobacteria bacterium]|nr:carbon starvation protein A [Deltaproteobacteria bacterium]
MSSTIAIALAIGIYFAFYKIYGRHLKRQVGTGKRATPAVRLYDGIDFVPANRYVLFGHHFASIAGAAPIVGPAIALAWGWLPALLWIWFGNVFIGAVHDYLSLMGSVRYDGHSVQWIAGRLIKKRTRYIFSIFVFFVLILLVAAFSSVVGNVYVAQPSVPTTQFLIIFSAIILGMLLYRIRMKFYLATAIGIFMLILAIFLGKISPFKASYQTWMIIIFVYIIIAASIPVNVLLQPRDYLNAWLLIFGLVLGGIAMIFSFTRLGLPAFTTFNAKVIAGKSTPFWPAIPLIIACGSLSGFHSLVASGTTSKQLERESDGLFIGYGGMLTEGFLSTLVVVVIAAYGPAFLGSFAASNYTDAIKAVGGPVGIFSKAYAEAIYRTLALPKELMMILAALWVSEFAMTTLDTTNRLARYTLIEIFEPLRDKLPKFSRFITNRWVASAIPATLGILLALTGAWSVLWPAFGGANQMLAAIALFTAAAFLIHVQKQRGLNTLIPALFLWITVSVAMIWYMFVCVPSFMKTSPIQAYIIGGIIIAMFILNILLIYDFFKSKG